MKCMDLNARALNEISLLASIESPHVVKYFDSFMEKNKLYLITEYCERGDIYHHLSMQMNIPLNEEKIWKLCLEILSGLSILHKQNLIHRDIKSKNIFLTKDGHAKIGDFGICIHPRNGEIQYPRELGSLFYASPEICKGDFYSAKTDIWSFGCVLYELCAFKTPFEASINKITMAKILNSNPSPISSIYSKDLQFLIMSCLNKNPCQRPSAAEILSFTCKYLIKLSYS